MSKPDFFIGSKGRSFSELGVIVDAVRQIQPLGEWSPS